MVTVIQKRRLGQRIDQDFGIELARMDAADKSVTIKLQRTGIANTYTLAPGASVPDGLETGKTVRVRVLAAQKGKVADRVELIVPTPAPKP